MTPDYALGPHTASLGLAYSGEIDHRGALLVADDVGNTIWRVTASPRITTQ